MDNDLPLAVTHEVRDRCLCLHLQRAARSIGRYFDDALRPVGLKQGQYSLLIAINRPEAPKMGEIAQLLALDRTTLTANLKPLERRGLIRIREDKDDRRGRRLVLTAKGRQLLKRAVPLWRAAHDSVDEMLGSDTGTDRLRANLLTLAFGSPGDITEARAT